MADLPVEILVLIFQNLIDDPFPCFHQRPRRVAEVCRLWREVASSMPCIRNTLPFLPLKSGRYILGLPLTRKFKGPGLLNFAVTNLTPVRLRHADFEVLNTAKEHWGHVEFLELDPEALRALSVGIVNKVSNVHTVKIRLLDAKYDYAGYFYGFEKTAGTLRHLEIESPAKLLLKVPFNKVEVYVERSKEAIGVSQVLHPDSSIQSFSYHSKETVPMVTTFSPEAPLPFLHTLNLHLPSEALRMITHPLSVPALERLKIVSDHPDALDIISALIARSDCGLHTLSILIHLPEAAQHRAQLMEHIQLLLQCPSLRNLEVNHLRRTIFQQLVGERDANDAFPVIKELIVHIPDIGYLEDIPSWAPYSNERLSFVRLIFPKVELGERLHAHRQLEPDFVVGPDRVDLFLPGDLRHAVESLEEEWAKHVAARATKETTLQKLWKPFFRDKSATIDRAFDYLEKYTSWTPAQIVFGRLYAPLSLFKDSGDLEISERAKVLLGQFDEALSQPGAQSALLQWRSEDSRTLIRTGKPCPPTLANLIAAERPWRADDRILSFGFLNLEKRIGSD